MKAFDEFLAKDFPEGNRADSLVRRLQFGPDAGSGAEAVRRQSHARERHEAGRKPQGLQDHEPAARHQDQYQPDRFRADQTGAAQEVQGRQMGVVRAHAKQRNRWLERSIRFIATDSPGALIRTGDGDDPWPTGGSRQHPDFPIPALANVHCIYEVLAHVGFCTFETCRLHRTMSAFEG